MQMRGQVWPSRQPVRRADPPTLFRNGHEPANLMVKLHSTGEGPGGTSSWEALWSWSVIIDVVPRKLSTFRQGDRKSTPEKWNLPCARWRLNRDPFHAAWA